MFSFWTRKGNKSPAPGRSANVQPEPQATPQESSKGRTLPRGAYPTSLPSQDDHPGLLHPPPQNATESVGTAAPNPHDTAILEVEAKISQAERLASSTSSSNTAPAHDVPSTSNPLPEPLYDPATGVQRGMFEPVACSDNQDTGDEVWGHLARMRALQSEIAKMHMNMEGLGEGTGAMNVEVDADIDVETVPSQEEEEAAKRQKEFEKLPEKFKGRADNINAMMAKLEELSKAVTSFHELQKLPLNFPSNTGFFDSTVDGERSKPSLRNIYIPSTDSNFGDVLHDSPTSHHTP